jgi:hypothetical protein
MERSHEKMNLTHDYLIKIGYQCNEDGTYAKSGSIPSGIPHAKPQPTPRQALVNSCEGESPRKARTTLIITRSACSLLDADNYAGGCKPLIDQLRYAKLIADDDPETIEILFRQVKVKTKAEEMTQVEIMRSCGDFKRGNDDLVNTCFD